MRRGGDRIALGKQGERLARDYFEREGYVIVAQNWRGRGGEIDLVAAKNGTIVFVEVRSRRDTGTFGTPEESVDYRKQRKVRQTAERFLHQTGRQDADVRFDVISVTFRTDGTLLDFEHIPGAF